MRTRHACATPAKRPRSCRPSIPSSRKALPCRRVPQAEDRALHLREHRRQRWHPTELRSQRALRNSTRLLETSSWRLIFYHMQAKGAAAFNSTVQQLRDSANKGRELSRIRNRDGVTSAVSTWPGGPASAVVGTSGKRAGAADLAIRPQRAGFAGEARIDHSEKHDSTTRNTSQSRAFRGTDREGITYP